MYKRSVVIAGLLLLGCVPSVAQTTATVVVNLSSGCPVSFSASRTGALVARAQQPDQPNVSPAPPDARVYVHFDRASVARIVEVKGRVYGTTAAPHVERLRTDTMDTSGPRARSQAFHFVGFQPNSSLDWKLDVTSVPLIGGISLTEIRMSDGTVWQETANEHCHAAISGLLPVGEAAR